ncbi:MAG: diversity-generating retroelement protein Avd [Spirochaetia bacterium]|jgi:four helix bundle protein|nr:diversity-generating retroelement protein Avd [Spirochaetia bacterium]
MKEQAMNELSRMEVRADDIIQYGYIAVKQFPKSEKFVLATRITDLMWEMAALISSAIDAQYNSDKIRLMKEADKELRKLRIMVRNSMKLGFLPFQKYEYWSKLNDELGRMIGAWMHQISNRKG